MPLDHLPECKKVSVSHCAIRNQWPTDTRSSNSILFSEDIEHFDLEFHNLDKNGNILFPTYLVSKHTHL